MGKVSNLDAYREKKSRKTKPFGEYACLVRNNRGLTQGAVGRLAGVDRSTVSRWESGALPVHPEDAVVLAKILNKVGLLSAYCDGCPVAMAMSVTMPKLAAVAQG
jgi:DNA-binding XRE family transcriptional regulator